MPQPVQPYYTELLTIQATPFCNLDCSYCYLPDRLNKSRFPLEYIPVLLHNMNRSRLFSEVLDISFHAGEPLVLPVAYYETAVHAFRKHTPATTELQFSFQSNGTLITKEVCSFLQKEQVRIGISIDGPEHIHDATRKTRSGKGSFAQTMKGVALLRAYDISFPVICVLTAYSLQYPDEMFFFFKDHDFHALAFNLEETEGINTSSSYTDQQLPELYSRFFYRFFQLNQLYGNIIRIREWEKVIRQLEDQDDLINGTQLPFYHLTVDTQGHFSTFSPELISVRHDQYGSFLFGNIFDALISDALKDEGFRRVYRDIKAGHDLCEQTCNYYSFCGGGMTSNKLHENGSFATTATKHCFYTEQLLANIVLEIAGNTQSKA